MKTIAVCYFGMVLILFSQMTLDLWDVAQSESPTLSECAIPLIGMLVLAALVLSFTLSWRELQKPKVRTYSGYIQTHGQVLRYFQDETVPQILQSVNADDLDSVKITVFGNPDWGKSA